MLYKEGTNTTMLFFNKRGKDLLSVWRDSFFVPERLSTGGGGFQESDGVVVVGVLVAPLVAVAPAAQAAVI